MLNYLVEWCPTLEPQHSLGHAKELMDKFESQLPALKVYPGTSGWSVRVTPSKILDGLGLGKCAGTYQGVNADIECICHILQMTPS